VTRRLFLLGGSAGTGKTTLARRLAGDLGAGWLQLDSLWLAMKVGAGKGTAAYDLLDIDGRMRREDGSDEDVLAAHVAAAEKVCSVLPTVLPLELQTHEALVVDGAWLLPSFVAGVSLPDCQVAGVYVTHTDESGVAEALAPRLEGRPPEEHHRRMNRRIHEYGVWLAEQARAHNLPVVEALPFDTLLSRVKSVLPH
jgi:2-phosphoglycerate kinase